MYVCSVLMLFTSGMLYAQPPRDRGGYGLTPEKKEKIEAMRAAFFTQRLDLTSEEAKVFWPVYNQYQNELEDLRNNKRSDMKEMRSDASKLTDKDYEKIFDSEVEFKQAELDIMKKYNAQLKTVLPMKKLSRLYKTESDFKWELLKQVREKGEHGGRSPGGKPNKS